MPDATTPTGVQMKGIGSTPMFLEQQKQQEELIREQQQRMIEQQQQQQVGVANQIYASYFLDMNCFTNILFTKYSRI